MDQIRTSIRTYITDNFLFGQNAGLRDDESLLERGILDSTGVLELVGHLESKYGIRVGDDELVPENLDSIQAISAFLARKQGPAA